MSKSYALYRKGDESFAENNFIEAIRYYDEVLTLIPDYYQALDKKGVSLDHIGRYNEAIECFDMVLRIKPDYYQAFNHKGLTLYNLGRCGEAIICYEFALKIKPDFADALNNKGLALDSIGKCNEAIECFDRALAIKPENEEIQYYKNSALKKLQNKRTEKKIQSSVSYEEFETIGISFLMEEKYDLAIKEFEKALKIKPDFQEAITYKRIAEDALKEKQKESNQTNTNTVVCDICCEKPKNVAFVPCGHVSCCEACSDKVFKGGKKCPICNSIVNSIFKVFIT